MEPKGTVFVVDDDLDARQSLKRLSESVNLPVQTYCNAQEFLDVYKPGIPGCLLLDVRMPGMSGLDLQVQLTTAGIRIPIIMISGHGDIPMAVQAVQRGALDFIEKPFRAQLLLDRIHDALLRDTEIRETEAASSAAARRLAGLTRRERQVLDRVVAGESTKEIAANLGLSPKTVDWHRAKIMDKLQAHTPTELVRMVIIPPRPHEDCPRGPQLTVGSTL